VKPYFVQPFERSWSRSVFCTQNRPRQNYLFNIPSPSLRKLRRSCTVTEMEIVHARKFLLFCHACTRSFLSYHPPTFFLALSCLAQFFPRQSKCCLSATPSNSRNASKLPNNKAGYTKGIASPWNRRLTAADSPHSIRARAHHNRNRSRQGRFARGDRNHKQVSWWPAVAQ